MLPESSLTIALEDLLNPGRLVVQRGAPTLPVTLTRSPGAPMRSEDVGCDPVAQGKAKQQIFDGVAGRAPDRQSAAGRHLQELQGSERVAHGRTLHEPDAQKYYGRSGLVALPIRLTRTHQQIDLAAFPI